LLSFSRWFCDWNPRAGVLLTTIANSNSNNNNNSNSNN